MNKAKLAPAELSAFCAQVSLMLASGLPLYDGMEALENSTKGTPEGEVYARVSADVQKTGSLYDALKADPVWPPYMVEMTGIGERSGCLENVMNGLSAYYEREGRIHSAIRSAVTYPIVLGVMMLAIILIMIVKVLPVFKRVLSGMGVTVNECGDWMMRAGATIGWVVMALVAVVVAVTLVCVVLMRTRARNKAVRAINACFPPLRRLNGRISAARTASVLSMLLSGGFPLEEALDMVPAVLTDGAAADEVQGLRQRMENGQSFADALSQGRLFDPLHARMIRMGAAVGREDQVMNSIARTYEEDAEEGVARLVSIIEPTLVAFLCIVIGTVLLSVMLPMAGIITSII